MLKCPACGAALPEGSDFGQCENLACAVMYVVEDGQVQIYDDNVAPGDPSPLSNTVDFEAAAGEAEAWQPLETNDFSETAPAEDNELEATAIFSADALEDPIEAPEPTFVGGESSEVEVTEVDGGGVGDGNDEFAAMYEDEDDAELLPEIDDAKDPLGTTRFDHSPASQLADGSLYYDVSISGIDTAELKERILRALSDKRFVWSSQELQRMIRRGRLNLTNLNPVMAVLVVVKMQEVDVDVEWSQKHFTDESVTASAKPAAVEEEP